MGLWIFLNKLDCWVSIRLHTAHHMSSMETCYAFCCCFFFIFEYMATIGVHFIGIWWNSFPLWNSRMVTWMRKCTSRVKDWHLNLWWTIPLSKEDLAASINPRWNTWASPLFFHYYRHSSKVHSPAWCGGKKRKNQMAWFQEWEIK